MRKPTDLLCGIDIGSEAVRVVLARATEDAAEAEGAEPIEVVAVGQAETANTVQYGEVVRRAGVTAAVRRAVEEAEQTAGVEVDSAWVSVGSRNRRSLNSSGTVTILEPGRPISERDVDRAVKAAIPRDGGAAWLRHPYELLHALPQEFWVDDLDATDDPTGWTGTNIQSFVHLVTCPRSSLGSLEEAVNGAGITVEKLVLAPLAAGYGVLDPEERKAEVVLLDIGAMTTDIAVFRHGVLWHSDLMPSGGRAYTRDIALGLRASHIAAERAKRRFGAALVDSVAEDDHFEIRVSGGSLPQLMPRRLLADVLQQRAESDFVKLRDQLRKALSTGIPAHLVLDRRRVEPRGVERGRPAGVRRRGGDARRPPRPGTPRSGGAPAFRLRRGALPLRTRTAPAGRRPPDHRNFAGPGAQPGRRRIPPGHPADPESPMNDSRHPPGPDHTSQGGSSMILFAEEPKPGKGASASPSEDPSRDEARNGSGLDAAWGEEAPEEAAAKIPEDSGGTPPKSDPPLRRPPPRLRRSRSRRRWSRSRTRRSRSWSRRSRLPGRRSRRRFGSPRAARRRRTLGRRTPRPPGSGLPAIGPPSR